MLHLIPSPVGRAAGRIFTAHRRVRRRLGVIDPDVRRLGVDTRRYLSLVLGMVVLVSSIAIPSGLAVRGALDEVSSTLAGSGEVTGARLAMVRTSAPVAVTPPDLRVHVQVPTSLPAGGSRQFRVAITGGAASGVPGVRDGADELVRVEIELPRSDLTAGLIEVTPSVSTVTRRNLLYVDFRVEVDATIACDAAIGDLLVRAVDVESGETLGEAHVALPPIDCRTPPPLIVGR